MKHFADVIACLRATGKVVASQPPVAKSQAGGARSLNCGIHVLEVSSQLLSFRIRPQRICLRHEVCKVILEDLPLELGDLLWEIETNHLRASVRSTAQFRR